MDLFEKSVSVQSPLLPSVPVVFPTAIFPLSTEGEPAYPFTGSPSRFNEAAHAAYMASARALAGIDALDIAPAPADASAGVQGRGAALILNTGSIEATPAPPVEGQYDPEGDVFNPHGDPYLFDPRGYAWPKPRTVTACGAPGKAVRGCRCKLKIVREHCDVHTCAEPFCQDAVRRRRAKRIERKMESGLGYIHDTIRAAEDRLIDLLEDPASKDKAISKAFRDLAKLADADALGAAKRSVFYTVFTVPPSRRAEAADPKTWRAWVDRIRRHLVEHLGMEYAVERSDPAGKCREANRTGEICYCADCSRWHPHMNFLWVRRPGPGDHHLTAEELAGLKAAWARILDVRFAVVYVDFANPSRPKYEKRHGRLRTRLEEEKILKHWWSYMGRVWPSWEEEFAYHCRVKWLGTVPRAAKNSEDDTCLECGERPVLMAFGTVEAAAAAASSWSFERLTEEKQMETWHRLKRFGRKWRSVNSGMEV